MSKSIGKSDALKKTLLEALRKTCGNITEACKKANVHRNTYYFYYDRDEDFRKEVACVKEELLDWGEGKLIEGINKGDKASAALLIFFLKTQGKHRGYVERTETYETMNIEPLKIEVLDPFVRTTEATERQ